MVRTETDVNCYLLKIFYYLKHGTYSADTSHSERSGIRKSKMKFTIIGKCLLYDE